ncbi:hypothetical protein [Lysobacter sp. CA196]|uniref:hypothetical protein n=1 Tax=Lysobacter sp. CA196 TaxID=3455606 RepID=UPI003F8D64F3
MKPQNVLIAQCNLAPVAHLTYSAARATARDTSHRAKRRIALETDSFELPLRVGNRRPYRCPSGV